MRKRRVLGSVVAAAALWYAWLAARSVGELSPLDSRRARQHDTAAFSPGAWRAAGPEARGRMVADLARRHRFVGRDPGDVRALLGATTCYAGQDDIPCYRVTLRGAPRDLVFWPDHSGTPWRVGAVGLSTGM